MIKFYLFVNFISVFVRQFILPNPFECFGDKAIVINWIAEGCIWLVSYWAVGQFYKKGDNPVIGSIAFLATYSAITCVLWALGKVQFVWWSILIAIFVVMALWVGIVYICREGNY